MFTNVDWVIMNIYNIWIEPKELEELINKGVWSIPGNVPAPLLQKELCRGEVFLGNWAVKITAKEERGKKEIWLRPSTGLTPMCLAQTARMWNTPQACTQAPFLKLFSILLSFYTFTSYKHYICLIIFKLLLGFFFSSVG